MSHLEISNNIWATISNSHTDRPTACIIKLGWVTALNLKISRLTIRNIIGLATPDLQFPESQLECLHLRITRFFNEQYSLKIRLSSDLRNDISHQKFACAHFTLIFRSLCVLYKLKISISLFENQKTFENTGWFVKEKWVWWCKLKFYNFLETFGWCYSQKWRLYKRKEVYIT